MTGNERSRADRRDAMDGEASRRQHGSGQAMTGSVLRQHDPGLGQMRWFLKDAVASRMGQ